MTISEISENTEIYIIISIMIIYTIYSVFAFKIHESFFERSSVIEPEMKIVHFRDVNEMNEFLKHQEVETDDLFEKILNSGVCEAGKFGAWTLFAWSIIMFILLLVYMRKENNIKNKMYRIIGIINLVLSIGYGSTSFYLNTPLFYRCIPYLVLQFITSVWLIAISNRK